MSVAVGCVIRINASAAQKATSAVNNNCDPRIHLATAAARVCREMCVSATASYKCAVYNLRIYVWHI